jgi:hypothetical protein
VRASGHGDHFGGCRGVRFGELYGVIGGFHGFEKLELLREFHPIMSCHCTAQHSEKRLQSDIPGFGVVKLMGAAANSARKLCPKVENTVSDERFRSSTPNKLTAPGPLVG